MARNLVMVKLRVIIATIFRRYTFVLEKPNEKVSDFSFANPPTD
jgi:hypothetical protein